jgi:hypothetical protein
MMELRVFWLATPLCSLSDSMMHSYGYPGRMHFSFQKKKRKLGNLPIVVDILGDVYL